MKKLQFIIEFTLASFFLTLLAAGTLLATPQKAHASTPIFGDVDCVNGNIDGIWFEDRSNPSYSGWAYKLSYYGVGSFYNWKKTVASTNDNYVLHVGCNGVWQNSPYTQHGYYNKLFLWVNGNSLIFSLTGGA